MKINEKRGRKIIINKGIPEKLFNQLVHLWDTDAMELMNEKGYNFE